MSAATTDIAGQLGEKGMENFTGLHHCFLSQMTHTDDGRRLLADLSRVTPLIQPPCRIRIQSQCSLFPVLLPMCPPSCRPLVALLHPLVQTW